MSIDLLGRLRATQDTTVSTTPITIAAANIKAVGERNPRFALVYVEAQPVRFTRNGTAPDNGAVPPVGVVWAAGNEPILLKGADEIIKFQVIKSGATDAVIHVEVYG